MKSIFGERFGEGFGEGFGKGLGNAFGNLLVCLILIGFGFGSGFVAKTIQVQWTRGTTEKKSTQTGGPLEVGDRVISQNTIDKHNKGGIKIRSTPKIELDDSNHIGWLFDGATGKIKDGPKYEDGHIWWYVLWEPGQSKLKIDCGRSDPCEGWNAQNFDIYSTLKKD